MFNIVGGWLTAREFKGSFKRQWFSFAISNFFQFKDKHCFSLVQKKHTILLEFIRFFEKMFVLTTNKKIK